MRNVNQMLAARALNFPTGKLFIAQEVLITMRTRKLVFAHNRQYSQNHQSHDELKVPLEAHRKPTFLT